mmetsp:Transcript_39374/g.61377  ORF Transcript_39374/g.61377 Transcript_39374/m.61377 type:complete len:97 (+) Transcript_39374:327-617(+)|eukprot:CAMPEP_0184302052 /NCGR_PEP_ID=MMETSP1049-20130417/12124_1 /TAXON_ID=77928 /ORGANISM="Proteomonas sulcata, Strain CCMP704" /LENGTH=96 /DNA_ID=CAMNT_0026613235 /DNA_START=322 /DNA_END=612 /DNA_ORIENTATION=+
MFQDVREFEELRALTFRMPHNAHRKASKPAAGGRGHHGGFYRPWAPSQGQGYIAYDNQLFWDHGFDYDNSFFKDPPAQASQQKSTDHHGFYGWVMK